MGCTVIRAIDALGFRGHLREAHRFASQHAHYLRTTTMYNVARFGMVPADSSRAEFQRILARAPRIMMTKLYGPWAADGDTAAIQTYVRLFEAGAPMTSSPMLRATRSTNAAAGRAYLALARRDSASALRQLLAIPDTLHQCWYVNRLTIARLLGAARRYREAAARLERRWPGTIDCGNAVDDVLWTLERARVFERVGRHAEAAESYAFVADAWRTADPELQPYVREAREGAARLGGGRR